MKKLGTLQLPPETKWSDEFQYAPVRGVIETSVGGYLVPFEQRTFGGRPVTLECDIEHGYFTVAHITAIVEMANQISSTFPFYWGNAIHTVIFSRDGQKPYEFQALDGYFDDSQEQLYTGKINLITTN